MSGIENIIEGISNADTEKNRLESKTGEETNGEVPEPIIEDISFILANGEEVKNKKTDLNEEIFQNGKSVGNYNVDESDSVENYSSKSNDSTNHKQFDELTRNITSRNLNTQQKKKLKKLLNALSSHDVEFLKQSAIGEYGLIEDDIRKKIWPILVGVDIYATSPRPLQEEIESHPYYRQVLLDVNRSLKRFPPSIEEKQRLAMQDQLVLLIMRILVKHPELHYYQGYHDICVTFLLVLGEEMAFHVVDRLSITHLRVYMEKNMEPTIEKLSYMFPIIGNEKPHLLGFLEKSDVGVMFSLSWLITWFGHVLNNYNDVVRLFDFFIASSPWMPVYLSTAIVLHREHEILDQECDMACVHSLLSKISDDLPFEDLITNSLRLYQTYSPRSLKQAVLDQLKLKREHLCRHRRQRGVVNSFMQKVNYVVPTQRLTVSIVIAAAVIFSAVLYQAYQT